MVFIFRRIPAWESPAFVHVARVNPLGRRSRVDVRFDVILVLELKLGKFLLRPLEILDRFLEIRFQSRPLLLHRTKFALHRKRQVLDVHVEGHMPP